MSYFDYGTDDFVPCEACGNRCVDIHHIDARGMGGSKDKDTIDNLMGLCRACHHNHGDKKESIEYLKTIHANFILTYS